MPAQRFAALINQLGIATKDNNEKVVKKFANYIIQKAMADFKVYERGESSDAIEQSIIDNMGSELYYSIKGLFFDVNGTLNVNPDRKVKIRFISCDKMVHVMLPGHEYDPYGTSVIAPLVFPAKLYLLTQLANNIIKLSRASVIRKWSIETGPRAQNANLIQKLKREFRNQRITTNDLMSFRTINQQLSDFKDMIQLKKKGQPFVDFEIVQAGDPNVKTQDLEDARQELIALSGVPAPYLGYADAVDLREQLVNINVTLN
jgi:hypothetical protein